MMGKEYIGGRLVSTKPEGLTGYQPGPTFPGVIGLAQGVFRGLSDVGEGDTTVNTIDGKDIYERYDGTTYSINMLGLPYDTVSKDSLEAKPMSSDQSEFMTRMMADASKNDAPVYGTNLTSAGGGFSGTGTNTGTADPCPEGYRMNPETNACEIDPFQTPFPTQGPLPADPGTLPVVVAAPSSPYTAATPYNLAPLTPSAQSAFVVPTPNVQPITVAQQTPAGLAGLPFRRV